MTIYALSIRKNSIRFYRTTAADADAARKIQKDPNYTAEGRVNAMAPLVDGLKRTFSKILAESVTLEEAAKLEYIANRPQATQRAAALKDATRAASVRALLTGAHTTHLMSFAKDAVSADDAVAACAIRMALEGAVVDETRRMEIIVELNKINAKQADASLADYVVARLERYDFERRGILNEYGIGDPLELMRVGRESMTIETPDDTAITLKDADVARFRQLVGVAEWGADDQLPKPAAAAPAPLSVTDPVGLLRQANASGAAA